MRTLRDLDTFIDRRRRFADAIGDGFAIITSAREIARNSDVH
jgi:hypothetical protein